MAALVWYLGATLLFSGGVVLWKRLRGRVTTREALPLGAGLIAVGLLLVVLTYFFADKGSEPAARAPTKPHPAADSAPNGKPAPNSSPTTSPAPEGSEEEIRQAYLRFEKVYAEAFLNQDPTRLQEVAEGSSLEAIRVLVDEARSKKEVWLIRVDSTITRVVRGEGLGGPGLGAVVQVKSVDHSVRLDPKTGTPLDPDRQLQLDKSYTMKPIGGTWKVVHITQYGGT